jgi:hypothetical protein
MVHGMRRFGHLTRPPRRRFAVLAAGSGLALLFGLTILTPVHFVPLFPLFWVLPFLAARAMVVAHPRSRHLPSDGRDRDDGRERQLLEAMERRGWITATRAALEASLSVAEADERLSRLAEKGHLQVNAYEGTLAYSLWDTDLPQARGAPTRRGEIEDGAS